MQASDRVVVLDSPRRHWGVIDHIGLTGLVLVTRADLPPGHPLQPVPYDAHDLEVCTCELDGGCGQALWDRVGPPLCAHSPSCAVRRHAEAVPPDGCCKAAA